MDFAFNSGSLQQLAKQLHKKPTSTFGPILGAQFPIEAGFTYLPVNLILGTPSLNCIGHGICRVFPRHAHWIANAISCPVTQARFIRNTNNGELYLLFDRSVLTNQIIEKYFSTPFFRMEEPFTLPKFVQTYFDLPKASSISSGTHLIKRANDCLLILLK